MNQHQSYECKKKKKKKQKTFFSHVDGLIINATNIPFFNFTQW